MTLQEKISRAYQLAYDLTNVPADNLYGLVAIRSKALRLKAAMQEIASTARAAQKRKCTHANLDAGHRSIRDWNGIRKVTQHFNCTDCGKTNIRVEEVNENV